ncbi:hypothetical protein AAG570_006977 [Ranatra chinensis]|uniref:Uncharacterized protein n=1 Tax=Ranatra chinensis TaxID=642074 RepID=A0ABD0YVM1_9HEMI
MFYQNKKQEPREMGKKKSYKRPSLNVIGPKIIGGLTSSANSKSPSNFLFLLASPAAASRATASRADQKTDLIADTLRPPPLLGNGGGERSPHELSDTRQELTAADPTHD